jgi:hypothetical protein
MMACKAAVPVHTMMACKAAVPVHTMMAYKDKVHPVTCHDGMQRE